MNFSKRFFGRGCSHRFTWPRIDADATTIRFARIVELLTNMTGR
jgi:hypothetical protein